jgi:hypothetical protein
MDGGSELFLLDCPWCGEAVEVFFELDLEGELVLDCEVCCRPWAVQLTADRDGGRSVRVERAD